MGQEIADQVFMFATNILLKRGLEPVLYVADLQDSAGVPTNGKVTQRRSQHKVVPLELTRGTEVE